MNKSLKYGLFLAILGIIVGGLLAFVNSVTAPLIAQKQIEEVLPMLKEVSHTTKNFKDLTKDIENLPTNVNKVFEDEGKTIVVYWVTTPGYGGGEIKTLVAFDILTKKIIDTKVSSTTNQTSGVGDQVETYNFNTAGQDPQKYANAKIIPGTTKKDDLKDEGLTFITRATTSSIGFLYGVKLASAHFLGNYGG
jgi:electron transport complex protein RnfG